MNKKLLILLTKIILFYIINNYNYVFKLLKLALMIPFAKILKINNKIINRVCWIIIYKNLFNNKIEYKNLKILEKNQERGYIIISNHINAIDYFIIKQIINLHSVSKSDTFSAEFSILTKLTKFLFRNCNIISYKRFDKNSGEKVKKKIFKLIKKNKKVLVFPEGRSSVTWENGCKPFRKGLFYLAYENKIPILPISLIFENKNYGVELNIKKFNIKEVLNDSSNIECKLFNFIYPENYNNFDDFYNKCYDTINNYLLKNASKKYK